MLPSLASMRDEKVPPTRKSTSDFVVCQSSLAAFHCLMSSGAFHARQTCSIGAAILVSTMILFVMTFLKGPQGQQSLQTAIAQPEPAPQQTAEYNGKDAIEDNRTRSDTDCA